MTGSRQADSYESVSAEGVTGTPASRGLRVGVVGLATVVQCGVVFMTFVLGLVWGGWTYALANVVALLGLGAILVLGARTSRSRPLLALLAVPVASALVTGVLYAAGTALEEAASCSPSEISAVERLRSPSGDPLTFEGSFDGECIARPDFVGPVPVEYRHYLEQLKGDGWRVLENDVPELALVTKDGIRVSVEVVPGEGMTLISVSDWSPVG